MKEYQAFVDIAPNGDWENPFVESLVIEAENAKKAEELAAQIAKENYPMDEFYVWEIKEDDILQ